MTFTDDLWRPAEPVYAAILEHPFLTGLTDGSLDESAFAFYVVQDALYLVDYARALALVGAKATEDRDVETFCRHAAGAIAVERQLHQELLGELGIRTPANPQQAPTTRAYTSYLLATVYAAPYEEGLGAVLPCYWIYERVGAQLVKADSPNPRYQRWIETYGGDEFASIVEEALVATDRVGARLGEQQRAWVSERFLTTARYEWMFWDMAYRKESWPV